MQARAGEQHQADRVGKIISSTIPLAAQDFLRCQPFAVLSSVDAQGQLWVSVLAGAPGFMYAADERSVVVDAAPSWHDTLRENLQINPNIGMLVMEFATRKRMRVNGKASLRDDGIMIHVEQVYSNCPKYIQAREWEMEEAIPSPGTVRRSDVLKAAQQICIQQADTFFIGTFHPEGGADASHRGGNPGFVRVHDEKTLLWPDYIGNNMFNTLGNIATSPQTGLLFVDFEKGATLQLTGRAKVIWDKERVTKFPGAQRLVEFTVDQIIEVTSALPISWSFQNYSPFNPT